MEARVDHLAEEGLARRQGQRVVFARDLLATLRRRELEETASKLSAETGLTYQPAAEGERVSGVYRQRVILASGRFAMIDDGLGFQLVPVAPGPGEKELGRDVRGVIAPERKCRLESWPKAGARTMACAFRQVPRPRESDFVPPMERPSRPPGSGSRLCGVAQRTERPVFYRSARPGREGCRFESCRRDRATIAGG